MNKKRVQNLPGFSLIELIILIAVMSILVGIATLGFGFLRSTDTKQVAYGIENGLKTLKSRDMAGKETQYLHIFVYNGKYYRTITNSVSAPTLDGNEKEIGSASSVTINVKYDKKDPSGASSGSRAVTLSESGTGAQKDICIGIAKKDGAFLYQSSGSGDLEAPQEIKVAASNGTTYLVYMVTDTGKHYVEAQ